MTKLINYLVIFSGVILFSSSALRAESIIPCHSVRAPVVMEENGKYFARIANPWSCPGETSSSSGKVSLYQVSEDKKYYKRIVEYSIDRSIRRAKIDNNGTLVIFAHEDIVAIDRTGKELFNRNVYDIYPKYIDRKHLKTKSRTQCDFWYCNGWEPSFEHESIILTEYTGCSFWLDIQKGRFQEFIEDCDSFIKSNKFKNVNASEAGSDASATRPL